jgi:hypothetical protein
MIRVASLVAAVIASLLLWHECGEDVGVFCYRIGLGAFTTLRSRALVPVPARASQIGLSRNRSACSTPSSTFSNRSTAQRDFES